MPKQEVKDIKQDIKQDIKPIKEEIQEEISLPLEIEETKPEITEENNEQEISSDHNELFIIPAGKPIEDWQANIFEPIKIDLERKTEQTIVPLNLEEALLIGMQNNISQQIIDTAINREKWRFVENASLMLPDFGVSYTLEDKTRDHRYYNYGTLNNLGFGLKYSISAGELFNSIASYYDWQGASAKSFTNLQDLLKKITVQYYETLKDRGELAVRIEGVKQAQENLNLNEILEEAGVGTRFSTLQSKEQLADNQLSLLSQQAKSRISEVQLLTLLNIPLSSKIELKETGIDIKTLVSPEEDFENLLNIALTSNPKLIENEMSYKASRHRIYEAVSDFTPTLSTTLSTNSLNPHFDKVINPDEYNNITSASVYLNWTILKGLGLGQISKINRRRAESRQLDLEMQQIMLETEDILRETYLQNESAFKQINIADEQLKAAKESVELARIRLQNGIGTNIDLIDTQRNYVNALINKVRTITLYNESQVNLLRALGTISVESIVK